MQKMIKLTCSICNKEFERRNAEHNRNLKLNRSICCSRTCGAISRNKKVKDNGKHLLNWAGYDRTDEYSPFRWHFNHSKRRTKLRSDNREFSITLKDLKNQWDKQKGICPYTGWELYNPKNVREYNKTPLLPNRASLDRIDSSKGYTKDNIVFISVIANYAKNKFTEQELIDFCNAVTNNRAMST